MDAALRRRGRESERAHSPATRVMGSVLLVLSLVGSNTSIAVAAEPPIPPTASAEDLRALGWVWPVAVVHVVRPYLAPSHPYGAGHRGIDLEAAVGSAVRAPAAGTIAFVGEVAGRGILTIDHGDGLVTTLEPVQSTLTAGAPVVRGDQVATLALGGHAAASTVHFGVRRAGEYINPMLLFDGVPRAVLLPCC
ncbi:murein hydrolase activator EnvC family protein [Microbacterium rhizomatis]|uniref:M23 family metallopeptidase n=1 Tax=Microbacterium rhizomatis TaxID=1631477 RepID=A0A5J5J3Q7_9MICO|nr:M23 family metallopeptidase [Microbacterium rhizomatis]KAA9110706.1 M23 family metallopeptidase [Microbacterium rhizomatis]